MILTGYPPCVYNQMMDIWKQHGQPDGDLVEHIIISLSDEERTYIDANLLYLIAVKISESLFGFQTLFVIHSDADNPHFHLVINRSSFLDENKLQLNIPYFAECIERTFDEFISYSIILNKSLKHMS